MINYLTSKFNEYKDEIKATAAGLSTGLLLLSPFGTDNEALAQKRDPSSEIDKSNAVAEKQIENIDQFRIHDFDGDENVEGVFADNQIVNGDKRALLAFYPFGEEDGDIHNTIYVMEGQHVKEIREDDIDGDGKQEVGIYGERDVLTADWKIDEQDLDFEKYEVPRGKTITDGQMLDGKHFIAVNDQDGKDYEFDFYQREDGVWKPVLSESTKEHVLQNLPDITSSFSPEEFLVGDFDDDGKYEVLTSDDKISIYTSDEVGFVYNKFPENPEGEPVDLSGDYQYANPVPWDSDEKKIVSVPDTEAQEKYNMGNSEKVVFITQSPAPGKKEANLGEMEPLSAISKSGKIITDAQIPLPYEEILQGQWDGNEWDGKYNRENFKKTYPYAASVKNPSGDDNLIVVTNDKHFREHARRNYYFGFDGANLPEHVENSKAHKMK
ncbi:MAG: hypothetical protein ABEK17_01520 [Candidatus Aenigmatarchaeota archaeon]